MSTDNSLNCYLGANFAPGGCKIVTLKLVWNNPNKKQSRKKYWANLRIVRDDQRRSA